MVSETLTITEQMDKIQAVLDEYEKGVGFNITYHENSFNDIDTYMNMDRTALNKLMPEDCAEIGYRLSQQSFFIQKAINKEQSRLTWAQGSLNIIIAKEVNSYDKYIKHENKVCLICENNSAANKLQKIIQFAQQRVDRLSFYTNGLHNLSHSIENIGRAKIHARQKA